MQKEDTKQWLLIRTIGITFLLYQNNFEGEHGCIIPVTLLIPIAFKAQ